ncbi:putative polyketide synthase [Mizugakiibacter sediminis]|uniref:Putative polyketide synthase n=1 Tax=Mizugakiibacter sediminis TaxID=1475481 RepID=A0A0K8QMT6_9GAMM|nr:putative polyketide synthase [Mizugakiibacter sediminis]
MLPRNEATARAGLFFENQSFTLHYCDTARTRTRRFVLSPASPRDNLQSRQPSQDLARGL